MASSESAAIGQEEADRDRRIFERGRAAALSGDERTDWLVAIVRDELRHAREKFPPFNSPHEGKAVIEEELDELWEHVKANDGEGVEAMMEAVQIAAMAMRYVYDLATTQGPGLSA